jgi:hypothetical protein
MNEELLREKLQRTGLGSIIIGMLNQDVNEPEAVALQLTTVDILLKVVTDYPVGDMIDQRLMGAALKFAERGIAKEGILDQVKGILNEDGGE